ncbi:MAG: transglutaminase family protein [Dehalococcoidia bacterium]
MVGVARDGPPPQPTRAHRFRNSLTILLFALLASCQRPPAVTPPGPHPDPLLERMLALYAEEDAGLDKASVRRRLDRLTAAAAVRLQGLTAPRQRIQALNRFFFVERGFVADLDLADADNLFLDRVLERRRGYCTGLASVYITIARRLGLSVYAVSTPSHLFLRHDDGTGTINIETLEDGREISDDTYRRRYHIPPISVQRGVFLRNLDEDRFLSQLINNAGTLRSRAGERQRAQELYRRALELDPLNVTARFNLARDQMRQERFLLAVEGYSLGLELRPNDPWSLNNRGVCRLRLGNRDGAVADFLEALSVDPGFVEARRNLDLLTD